LVDSVEGPLNIPEFRKTLNRCHPFSWQCHDYNKNQLLCQTMT